MKEQTSSEIKSWLGAFLRECCFQVGAGFMAANCYTGSTQTSSKNKSNNLLTTSFLFVALGSGTPFLCHW